ncbi:hypothetical protein BKA00_005177 [Actinomadura coerulea]|uniref:Uncharacterized protein n=1 Tax=Actinomadura coerulea TaxID=46159 RepID=A0A7X0G2K4_9ACTN|nr:nitroreductase/quinone reductase family protein [Actinomadura coerulea]MBB6398263.1 hypothetical protein [Actinomadura coerulea]GGQ10928.1 hypothetical protein GCM10010187_29070 [Actinomadura coerulea]
MAQNQQVKARKSGKPGSVSRWLQRTMNARITRKIRRGRAKFMGMDVLVLNTVRRRSGQPRETPVSWFPDGDDAWLVVASGGGAVPVTPPRPPLTPTCCVRIPYGDGVL